MRKSSDRILTTHAGSLPRPEHIARMMFRIVDGADVDAHAVDEQVREAVADVVARQRKTGLDIISDGEMGKVGFATYPLQRYSGFSRAGVPPMLQFADLADIPAVAAQILVGEGVARMAPQVLEGPLELSHPEVLRHEIDDLLKALGGASADDAFVSEMSPFQFAAYFPNRYYRGQEEYLEAVISVLAQEYRTIIDSGLNLQIDSPILASAAHIQVEGGEIPDMQQVLDLSTDTLNAALSGLPSDRVRLHVCWGNYGGPHHKDAELRRFIEPLLRSRVGFISIEAANPRHEHEWQVWQEVALPDDKALIPGVIDTNTNRVEHPQLVAQRIERFASCVGRERVIAGTDCGFETFAGVPACNPDVAWLKLQSLVEGADIASNRLW